MLFRNLVLFTLPAGWPEDTAALADALGRHPLRSCGEFDMRTRGWVACGPEGQVLFSQEGHHLLALGIQQKLLPASVIREETRQRAEQLAARQGHPPGRRQLRELKARVTDELCARALTRRSAVAGWIDPASARLAIDTSSVARAEEFTETLRDTLGGFAVVRTASAESPGTTMAGWLLRGDAPGRFRIDQDLELRSADDTAAVRYVRHPLDGREIRAHLDDGKRPFRLGLTWNDRIAFVLERDLGLRRVRFLDTGSDDTVAEDPATRFAADFALMTGELSQLLDELLTALGGEDRQHGGHAPR